MDELTGGVVTRTYTYGLQRISQDQVIENVWTPSFYGYDGGGNVRQLTNSPGTVTDKYEYDAFGNDVYHTGTTPNNYLYRGEQYDSDLGLYYLRARYYNPATGRFLSRDPAEAKLTDPATLHRYLYAGGDPINRVDPMGEEAFLESKLLKKIITVTYYSVVLPAVVICGEVSIINFITQELLKENGFPYSILQPCSGVRNAAMTAGVWLLLFP
jgi:RHS repeat-associated protein